MKKDGVVILAVPALDSSGLDAERSGHFGRCGRFTIVEIESSKIEGVRVIDNAHHQRGGCQGPVDLLTENGVDALVVGGIGGRPLLRLNDAGVDVYFDSSSTTVRQAVEVFVGGSLEPMKPEWVCPGD